MTKESNTYTFLFALAVCALCSFTLAAVSEGLRDKREMNQALDIKKNILKAVNLLEPIPRKATGDEVLEIFQQKIEELVIDDKGNILSGLRPDDIQEGEKKYPLYIYKEGDVVLSYSFPVEGKGLWSTLYGYFALEPDAITVRGITFYKHGETAGLGAEIEKAWFQDNFKGKKIWDIKNQKLVPITVLKGKVKDKISVDQKSYYVDGITGATITSQGVTELLEKGLNIYEPFLAKIRTENARNINTKR